VAIDVCVLEIKVWKSEDAGYICDDTSCSF